MRGDAPGHGGHTGYPCPDTPGCAMHYTAARDLHRCEITEHGSRSCGVRVSRCAPAGCCEEAEPCCVWSSRLFEECSFPMSDGDAFSRSVDPVRLKRDVAMTVEE